MVFCTLNQLICGLFILFGGNLGIGCPFTLNWENGFGIPIVLNHFILRPDPL